MAENSKTQTKVQDESKPVHSNKETADWRPHLEQPVYVGINNRHNIIIHKQQMETAESNCSFNTKGLHQQTDLSEHSSSTAPNSTKLGKKISKIVEEDSKYHWSESEQKRYINFLFERRKSFDMSIKDKRAKGIHTKMSKYIHSRTPNQCRSHHQKMLIKWGSIDGVLKQFRGYIYQSNFKKFDPLQDISTTIKEQCLEKEKQIEMIAVDIINMEEPFKKKDYVEKLFQCYPIQFFDVELLCFKEDSLGFDLE